MQGTRASGDGIMRHGVIIVHGAGQHKPFETLMGFATGFVDTMYDLVQSGEAEGSAQDLDFRVEVDPEGDESKDNYIEVSHHPPGQEPHAFRIKEVRWAEVFQPHSWLRMFLWLLRSLWPQVWSTPWVDRVLTLFMLFVVIIPAGLGILASLAWLLVPFARLIERIQWAQSWAQGFLQWLAGMGRFAPWLPPATLEPAWRWLPTLLFVVIVAPRAWRYVIGRRKRQRHKRQERLEPTSPLDRIGHAFNRAVLLLLFPLAFLVLCGAWVVGSLPSFPGKGVLQGVLGRIARFLVVESVGDIEVYMSDTLLAAQIRQVVEEAITYFTVEDGWKAEDIHVIGHSLGSVICFEVLARTLPEKIRDQVSTFFSAGSPLDKMKWFFTSRPREHAPQSLKAAARGTAPRKRINVLQQQVALALTEGQRERYFDYSYRFREQMLGIPWYNIRGTFDPVCGGISKEGTWFDPVPLDVVVTNANNPLRDHSAYWRKSSQALRFILGVIWLKEKPYRALYEANRLWG